MRLRRGPTHSLGSSRTSSRSAATGPAQAAELLAALEFPSNAFIPGNARALAYYLQRMCSRNIIIDFHRSNGVRGIYL